MLLKNENLVTNEMGKAIDFYKRCMLFIFHLSGLNNLLKSVPINLAVFLNYDQDLKTFPN